MALEQDELIRRELALVKKDIRNINFTSVVACVPHIVRFSIKRTKHKQLDVIFQFPKSGYPDSELILVEFKSKVLPEKFLDSLGKAIEASKSDFLGSYQILPIVKFVLTFLEKNPLCVCAGEISSLKKSLQESVGDQLKIRQKNSSISLKICEGAYFVTVKASIPEDYPDSPAVFEAEGSNFPKSFANFFIAQLKESARQCVEPPMLRKAKDPKKVLQAHRNFEKKPSLEGPLKFVIDLVKRYPNESCSLCGKCPFPNDPEQICENSEEDHFINRVYCSHIFHHKCLDRYMKTPPFQGGKKCPGPKCGKIIYHEDYRVGERTAEERWAHQQAKMRELEEVEDFLS